MSEYVEIDGGHSEENAVLLLDAADKLGLEPDVVRTTSFGFSVPEEVAKKAGLDPAKDEFQEEVEQEESGLDFRTRAEAEEYAEAHNLTIENASDLKADEYKDAVRRAAKGE